MRTGGVHYLFAKASTPTGKQNLSKVADGDGDGDDDDTFQQTSPLSLSWGTLRPDPEMPPRRLPEGMTRLRAVLTVLATLKMAPSDQRIPKVQSKKFTNPQELCSPPSSRHLQQTFRVTESTHRLSAQSSEVFPPHGEAALHSLLRCDPHQIGGCCLAGNHVVALQTMRMRSRCNWIRQPDPELHAFLALYTIWSLRRSNRFMRKIEPEMIILDVVQSCNSEASTESVVKYAQRVYKNKGCVSMSPEHKPKWNRSGHILSKISEGKKQNTRSLNTASDFAFSTCEMHSCLMLWRFFCVSKHMMFITSLLSSLSLSSSSSLVLQSLFYLSPLSLSPLRSLLCSFLVAAGCCWFFALGGRFLCFPRIRSCHSRHC